jgi:hypothetical protein
MIKAGIVFGLLILAAVNVSIILLIARTPQLVPIDWRVISTTSPENLNQSSDLLIIEDSPPSPQEEITNTQPTPQPTLEELPVLRSPFSLQIAALHQMSIDGTTQEGESEGGSNNQTEELTFGENPFSSLGEALKESGADWTRVRIEWELIEPRAPVPGRQPVYDWQYHDDNLSLVAESGVSMIATLSDSPGWAASYPCAPIFPERLDDFARFLTDLVDRYKEPPFNIHHWELVNEPDSNRLITGQFSGHGCWAYEDEQYVQMLEVANQAIKAVDPQATILMGGIAYDWFTEYGGPFFRYFPDNVMFNGGGDHFDVLNFHFFTDFSAEWDRWNPQSEDRQNDWIPAPTCGEVDDGIDTPYEVEGFDVIAKTTHFRNRMEVCFGISKPVWITEVAGHGYPDDQESLDEQARYVIMVYARALSAGVENVTWFSLDQPPYDPFGQALLYPDFSPKPAYFAYQMLTRELDGFFDYSHNRNDCSWDSSGVSCSIEAYIFKNDFGSEKTVAWGSGQLAFKTDHLRLVDRQGNVTFILDGRAGDEDGELDGFVNLQLSAEPVFISSR